MIAATTGSDTPFTDCDGDTPYSGESTTVSHRTTCYGGAALDLELSTDDRIAVWVAGHWLTGTVTGTQLTDPDRSPLTIRRYRVTIEVDDTHRDDHSPLPSKQVKLVTSTDNDYTLGPNGWKTVDASVKTDPENSASCVLLGACGDIVKLIE